MATFIYAEKLLSAEHQTISSQDSSCRVLWRFPLVSNGNPSNHSCDHYINVNSAKAPSCSD